MKSKIILNPNRQQHLLEKLVDDSCNKLPINERSIDKISLEGLVWNLFKGKYDFNVTDVKFVIEAKLKSEGGRVYLKEINTDLYIQTNK